MIVLQLILFCAWFTLMVKIAVENNALNGLYFYPKPVRERAFEIGLTDRETADRKRKRFMAPFFLVMLTALVLIIGLWNGVNSFWPAYLQALLFLEVMNWYDGIVIDKVWVGYSKFWLLPGCEGSDYTEGQRAFLRSKENRMDPYDYRHSDGPRRGSGRDLGRNQKRVYFIAARKLPKM